MIPNAVEGGVSPPSALSVFMLLGLVAPLPVLALALLVEASVIHIGLVARFEPVPVGFILVSIPIAILFALGIINPMLTCFLAHLVFILRPRYSERAHWRHNRRRQTQSRKVVGITTHKFPPDVPEYDASFTNPVVSEKVLRQLHTKRVRQI